MGPHVRITLVNVTRLSLSIYTKKLLLLDSHDGTIWTFEASTKERRVNPPPLLPHSTDGEEWRPFAIHAEKKKNPSNCTSVSILKKKNQVYWAVVGWHECWCHYNTGPAGATRHPSLMLIITEGMDLIQFPTQLETLSVVLNNGFPLFHSSAFVPRLPQSISPPLRSPLDGISLPCSAEERLIDPFPGTAWSKALESRGRKGIGWGTGNKNESLHPTPKKGGWMRLVWIIR